MTLYVSECRRCGAQRMSFDVYGVSTVAEAEEFRDFRYNTTYRRTIELACRCHECSCTTVFVLQAEDSSLHELPKIGFEKNENPLSLGYKERGAFPPKQALPTPADTPEPAASFYKQAATAMAHGLYDAAGAMFRKCLESVTRTEKLLEMVPQDERDRFKKAWLKQRITILKDVHAIPPALAELVDVIKDQGDDAVHADVLYDKNDAESLQRFAKTFLEQTFTIPAQIARVRAKSKRS